MKNNSKLTKKRKYLQVIGAVTDWFLSSLWVHECDSCLSSVPLGFLGLFNCLPSSRTLLVFVCTASVVSIPWFQLPSKVVFPISLLPSFCILMAHPGPHSDPAPASRSSGWDFDSGMGKQESLMTPRLPALVWAEAVPPTEEGIPEQKLVWEKIMRSV